MNEDINVRHVDKYFCKYFYKIDGFVLTRHKMYRKLQYVNPDEFYSDNDNSKNYSNNCTKENELISVNILTYNRSDKVKISIQSLLNQTYSNIEILIIDDGSDDDTYNNLKDIIKSNKNKLKYVKCKKNKGNWHARNVGIKYSKGKYITFCDSDDISDSNKLELLYNTLRKYNLLFVGCQMIRTHINNFDLYLKNDKFNFKKINKQIQTDISNNNLQHNLQCCNPIVGFATILYDKKIFDTVGVYKKMIYGTDSNLLERFCKYYNVEIDPQTSSVHHHMSLYRFHKLYCFIEPILYYSTELDSKNLTSLDRINK